jgi:hypothetical protein
MSDAARLSLVAFHNTSAEDVIEKLRREIDRIDAAGGQEFIRDHVVNAFWTAWHVHNWMWNAIKEKPDLKTAVLKYRGIENERIEDHESFGAALARRFVPLRICRMVATSSRYVHVGLSMDVLTVASTTDPADASPCGAMVNLESVRPIPMVVILGKPVAATRLLVEVDDYWVTMILECEIE